MRDPLFALVKARYESDEEVAKYRERARSGFLDWEKTVQGTYFAKTGNVLDIGCGCGREAIALAQCGHTVTGIDLSETQVRIAAAIARECGCTIDFRSTDGLDLDFPPGTFECVVIWSQVLGNVPGSRNRLALLEEAFRVTKPRGILSLSVHNRSVCERIALERGLVVPSPGFDLEDGDFIEIGEPPTMGPCYWHYFARPELVELLAAAGFTVLECDVAPAFGQIRHDRRQLGWDTLLIAVAQKAG